MSDSLSGPEHPDHSHPWAMQMVINRNKRAPANHLDVLQAAGMAVVQLLDDPRATDPDGAWHAAVTYWRAGWIRKVVRRAENKRWDDVQHLPGITATAATGQVRAFVPGPVQPLVPQLNKLQVRDTQLPRAAAPSHTAAIVTVELTPVVVLSTGKAAAQVGHAAQLAYEQLCDDAAAGDRTADRILAAWRAEQFRLAVIEAGVAQWENTARPVRVLDAGLTEISGATETARAWWHLG